jgi:hypothetical protein
MATLYLTVGLALEESTMPASFKAVNAYQSLFAPKIIISRGIPERSRAPL